MNDVAVTIRMSEEEAELFKKNARDNKKTQREFVLDLMDMSLNASKQDNSILARSNSEGQISLVCYTKNKLTQDENYKEKKAQVYKFFGTPLLVGFLPNNCNRHAIDYKEQLKTDFAIDISDEELQNYNLVEFLNVYEEAEKDYYLIYEYISLVNVKNGEIDLLVYRISYVRDMYDKMQEKYPYAHEEEIKNAKISTAKPLPQDVIEIR